MDGQGDAVRRQWRKTAPSLVKKMLHMMSECFIYIYYVEDVTDTFGNVTYKVGDVTDDIGVLLIMSEMLQMISECYKSLIINLERWQEVSS